jgi:hypothetical protein
MPKMPIFYVMSTRHNVEITALKKQILKKNEIQQPQQE